MSINRISETILEKVRQEADSIIKDAEVRALERIEQATRQQADKFQAEKDRQVREAEGEAARIMARASIQARQEISAAKAEIVQSIIGRVKEEFGKGSGQGEATLNLISQSIAELGAGKAVLFVSPADLAAVKKLVKEDKNLSKKVIDVREYNCSGGIIAEDEAGSNRIDNTYEARLEKLLPQIMPEISRELFKK